MVGLFFFILQFHLEHQQNLDRINYLGCLDWIKMPLISTRCFQNEIDMINDVSKRKIWYERVEDVNFDWNQRGKTQNVDCRVEKNLECISSSLWPLANHSILNSIFQILHWEFIYGINRSINWQNKCHSSNYEIKKRIDSIRSWEGKWIRNVIFMANGWLQSLWLIKMMMQVLHIFWGLNFLKLLRKSLYQPNYVVVFSFGE